MRTAGCAASPASTRPSVCSKPARGDRSALPRRWRAILAWRSDTDHLGRESVHRLRRRHRCRNALGRRRGPDASTTCWRRSGRWPGTWRWRSSACWWAVAAGGVLCRPHGSAGRSRTDDGRAIAAAGRTATSRRRIPATERSGEIGAMAAAVSILPRTTLWRTGASRSARARRRSGLPLSEKRRTLEALARSLRGVGRGGGGRRFRRGRLQHAR